MSANATNANSNNASSGEGRSAPASLTDAQATTRPHAAPHSPSHPPEPHRAAERSIALDADSLAALAAEMVKAAATSGGLLDAAQAGLLLNVPASWLLAEARRDRVPHTRLGARYVRFDREALLAWVADRSRGPRTGSQPVSRARKAP